MKLNQLNHEDNLLDTILLREVQKSDLPIFFAQQSDPTAMFMAAFTAEDPTNHKLFMSHWRKIMKDESIMI